MTFSQFQAILMALDLRRAPRSGDDGLLASLLNQANDTGSPKTSKKKRPLL